MDSFGPSLRRLLAVSEKILKRKEELDDNLDLDGRGNPILKCLNQYARCFLKTRVDEIEDFHIDLFRRVYKEHRNDILEIPNTWLNKHSVVIQYGSNLPEPIKCNFKIYLAHIYEIATVMRDDVETKLEGKSDEDYQNADELNYPEGLLLHTYRIFASFIDDRSDTAKVNVIITDLEDKLGIGDNQSSSGGTTTGFGGLLDFVSGAAQQMGLNQDGIDQSSGGDLGSAIQSVFSNKGIQDSLGQIFADVEGSNDIGEVIGKLVGGLGDEKFKNAIGEAVGGISDKVDKPGSGASVDSNGSDQPSEPSSAQPSESTSDPPSEPSTTTDDVDDDEDIPFVEDD